MLGLAVLLTVVGLGIVLACVIDDRTITESRGESVADVLDTSPIRTVVRFSADDGRVYIPPNGVLYPSGLQEGQTIQVEYNRDNPELVRVMGRGAELSLLPVGSSLAVVWAVLLPAYIVLRRSAAR